ncbi:MAG: DUF4397 domain-containing protein [Bacteroidota bacterium]
MRTSLRLAALCALLVPGLALAQTAQVQVIHNSPDPGATVVDVYINGDLAIDDFEFRTATPYLDLPADTELLIDVAPGDSESAAETLGTFPFTLDEGVNYQLIATGVLAPDAFSMNPNEVSTAFTLLAAAETRTTSDAGNVSFAIVHGSPDAPTVDIEARGVALLATATYTDISDYVTVPAAQYTIDIKPAGVDFVVASFQAPLARAAGQAGTILASGFLTPEDDQDGPAFALLGVLPSGATFLLPPASAPTAPVQIIHNSPDPGAAIVDVYLNGELAVDDLPFRKATPYLPLPAESAIEVAIAPGTSESVEEALDTFTFVLDAGVNYQVIATGVLDPEAFSMNPNEVSTAFTLLAAAETRMMASDPSLVEFSVVHGSPDAPTVDVIARDVATLATVTFQDITGYVGVAPDAYTIDIAPAGGAPIASFAADLSAAGGSAFTILASGFLSPDDDQDGEAFGLLAVLPNGSAKLLPAAALPEGDGVRAGDAAAEALPSQLVLDGAYPNPFTTTARIGFGLPADAEVSVRVYDVLGREVMALPAQSFAASAAQSVEVEAASLAAGTYVYRVEAQMGAEVQTQTGRMTVLK